MADGPAPLPRAVLVCQESVITDPEIQKLCEAVVGTRRGEIAQMGQIFDED